MGRLGGSVSYVPEFNSGHDLTVHGFEAHVSLCADSSEPGACFGFCVSLSLYPSLTCALSLCLSVIFDRGQNMSRGGAEREGDTEYEAGFRL